MWEKVLPLNQKRPMFSRVNRFCVKEGIRGSSMDESNITAVSGVDNWGGCDDKETYSSGSAVVFGLACFKPWTLVLIWLFLLTILSAPSESGSALWLCMDSTSCENWRSASVCRAPGSKCFVRRHQSKSSCQWSVKRVWVTSVLDTFLSLWDLK